MGKQWEGGREGHGEGSGRWHGTGQAGQPILALESDRFFGPAGLLEKLYSSSSFYAQDEEDPAG